MITKLYLENFRSIVDNEVELGKVTILTGPNNSGKSSAIYGLLTLRNVALSSNQGLDSFLNFNFVNLGGFSQTVYRKDEKLNIGIGIDVSAKQIDSHYSVSLGKKESILNLKTTKPFQISLNLGVTFPYPSNRNVGSEIKQKFGTIKTTWNGAAPTITIEGTEGFSETDKEDIINQLSKSLTAPMEELRALDIIPLRRGFTKATYSSVPMQAQLLNEDELATLIATDRDLEGDVTFHLEKIVERHFSVRPTIGTANFNLQSLDRSTGLVCDLVNEGFGTNQLVTILTKVLRKETKTICIEETEIHLHPEIMNKLIDVFVKIVKEEDKCFIISTHSEHIVLSLLNKIAQKEMAPDDVRIYYFSKDGKKTRIEKQEINDKGQIKGGLKGFYEAELKGVREFFDVPEEG